MAAHARRLIDTLRTGGAKPRVLMSHWNPE